MIKEIKVKYKKIKLVVCVILFNKMGSAQFRLFVFVLKKKEQSNYNMSPTGLDHTTLN